MAWLYAKYPQRWYDIEKAQQVYRSNVSIQGHEAVVIQFGDGGCVTLLDPDDAAVALRWLDKHAESW